MQTAAVSAGHLADTEPQQRFARAFWRETSPRLHPSRGECRYTVLVGWRVPFVVCVGEVASSRAWSLMWSMMYDGSVECDASLKLDVLLFAPKEQKIKKNTT